MLGKSEDQSNSNAKDEDFLPTTALYDKSMLKYVQLYEDTVSDDEGSSSNGEKTNEEGDEEKKEKTKDSKYSHSRFSS
jgi:hypothetical protein